MSISLGLAFASLVALLFVLRLFAKADGVIWDEGCERWWREQQVRVGYTGGSHVRRARIIPFQPRTALHGSHSSPVGQPPHLGAA